MDISCNRNCMSGRNNRYAQMSCGVLMERIISWAQQTAHFSSLVVIFEDFEEISSALNDIFSVFIELHDRGLPIGVILLYPLGLVLPDLVGNSNLATLHFRHFYLADQAVVLDYFFSNLYSRDFPVLFSGEILNWLVECFDNCNHSVADVVKTLKTALVLHFDQEGSFLCCLLCPSLAKTYGGDIMRCLNKVRHSSSFVSSFANDHDELDSLPLSFFKRILKESIQIRNRFNIAYDILHIIMFGKLARDHLHFGESRKLLEDFLLDGSSKVSKAIFSVACEKVKDMDVAEVLTVLIQWRKLSLLNKKYCCSVEETQEIIYGARAQITRLLDAINEFIILFANHAMPTSSVDMVAPNMGEHTVMADADNASTLQDLYEDLCSNLRGELENTIARMADPLHRLLTYSNLNALRQATTFQPRRLVSAALGRPSDYIRCKCCNSGVERKIAPEMEDSCIMFYLLRKYRGRYVYFGEWFRDFYAIVGKKDNGAEQRFFATIEEFEFIGLTEFCDSKCNTYEKTAVVWTMV
mmetsp:Transcript_12366/g.27124  ORF Transcript_12366/g.27124 Transcript_12366/m.27124 type:complete len:525 (-) Transcript_12366:75-1649(-)